MKTAFGFSFPSSKRTSTLSLYSRSSGSIMKLRLKIRSEIASLTTVTPLWSSAAFADTALMYINFTVAPWLVVKRRMGVNVLTYLKFRKMGERLISS